MRFFRHTPVPAWLSLVAAITHAGSARATGFGVARFTGEHGHPTTQNATASYYNPAALTQGDAAHVLVDWNLAYRRLTYDRTAQPSDAPAPGDAAEANVGRALLSNWLVGPTLAASARAHDFAFGVIACIPFGAPVSFEQRDEFADHPRLPGPVDGVARFHAIEGSFITGQLTAAAAYRFDDARVSLGVSLSLMHTLLHDVRARADGTNDVEEEGRSLIEANGSAVAAGLGILWEPFEDELWLGGSYQSRPNFAGGMKLHGSVTNRLGTTETRADVDIGYDLPDSVRLGARYRPTRDTELRLFGDYTRWSAFERQCIRNAGHECILLPDGSQPHGGSVLQNLDRGWHDAAEVRAGFSYFVSSEVEFFSGVGAWSSAVPDERLEPGLPDFPGASFALGARVALSSKLAVATSFAHFVFVPRTATSKLAEAELPTRQPDASGTYKQMVDVLNANLDVAF